MPRTITTALIGLGNVNRSFLQLLATKGDPIATQYGLAFRIVGVADSSGVATNPAGFDPAQLRQFKENGGRVQQLGEFLLNRTPADLLNDLACDLVLEASPVDLKTGDPGLSATRAALRRGISVVLANKGPLVLAFRELHQLAATSGAGLAFSATVCGALPVINIGRRDLIAAKINRLQGIFNSTSNFILAEMAQGRPYTEALAEAQRRGIAETDPTLDVEGWDTANKLVIIANSFLGIDATLADVAVQGITAITSLELQKAAAKNQTIKLVAAAHVNGDSYRLTVAPTLLPNADFLAGCQGWEMGIEIETDIYGTMRYKIDERSALPTAAAMLRDAVNLFSRTVEEGR